MQNAKIATCLSGFVSLFKRALKNRDQRPIGIPENSQNSEREKAVIKFGRERERESEINRNTGTGRAH